jgi:hypothetical protein
MQDFIPALSPTKLKMLSPSRRHFDSFEDDLIEIPDSAGLSDATRDAIYNIWTAPDEDDDKENGRIDGMHYPQVGHQQFLLTTGLSSRSI